MPITLRGRSLLSLDDLSATEFRFLLRLAIGLKAAKSDGGGQPRLAGKSIALINETATASSRSGFEVAACGEGAQISYLGRSGGRGATGEPTGDLARLLGQIYDAIEYRGSGQTLAGQLARHAGVPVYNGLIDAAHPTQVLAEFMTMREATPKPLSDTTLVFLGDASTAGVGALATGAAKIGLDMRIAAPRDLWPDAARVGRIRAWCAATGGRFAMSEDVAAAVRGADFLYAEDAAGIGAGSGQRRPTAPYRITREVMAATGNPSVKFMQCLPAYPGRAGGWDPAGGPGSACLEPTDAVFESRASIVFDAADNRMYSITAMLVATIGGEARPAGA